MIKFMGGGEGEGRSSSPLADLSGLGVDGGGWAYMCVVSG